MWSQGLVALILHIVKHLSARNSDTTTPGKVHTVNITLHTIAKQWTRNRPTVKHLWLYGKTSLNGKLFPCMVHVNNKNQSYPLMDH